MSVKKMLYQRLLEQHEKINAAAIDGLSSKDAVNMLQAYFETLKAYNDALDQEKKK